jgi:beta-phosphoglucomutase-like phosphatase (HAD superfamily)
VTGSHARPWLVIFDCDGILVDTEEPANRYLSRALAASGHAVSYEDCRRRFVGLTLEAIQAEVEAESGLVLGADWPDTIRRGTEQAFEAGVTRIGAADLTWCVASSGRLSKMRMSLEKAGLLDRFDDVLFSAEQVGRGKPAPDLFLYAAATMGVPPGRPVVVEDSVPGVTAGVAAGIRTLAYAGNTFANREALERAGGELFLDMAALPGLLGI